MHDAFQTFLLNEKGKAEVREIARLFDGMLDAIKAREVDGRHLALITTKLEECCFFAKKSIALKLENQEAP